MSVLKIDPTAVTTATNCDGPVILVPSDQAYFWTEEWQAGERESAAARQAGETVTFYASDDLTRWLLDVDDDGLG